MRAPRQHGAFQEGEDGGGQTFFPKLRPMVQPLTCNVFGEQTYVVDHGNGSLTVVDPGMASPQEREAFQRICDSLGGQPAQVLLTHGHLDHVMGCQWMKDTYGLLPRMHPLDEETYRRGPIAAQMYGVSMDPLPDVVMDLVPGEGDGEAVCAFGDRKTHGIVPESSNRARSAALDLNVFARHFLYPKAQDSDLQLP